MAVQGPSLPGRAGLLERVGLCVASGRERYEWRARGVMIPTPLLLEAYREGFFPMAMPDGRIRWFSPDPRGILPLDRFHAPRRLARVIRQARFAIGIDTAFSEVIRACGEHADTWISHEIIESYCALHEIGRAHSIEVRDAGELVGGLYGVSLGGAFFGESMFHRVTDASKVALIALVERLRARRYHLLDIQWLTPHLAGFGATEVPRDRYLGLLRESQSLQRRFADGQPAVRSVE